MGRKNHRMLSLSTIYGIQRAPCDTYMRETLDPVSPEALRPSFKSVFRQLQRGKALEAMLLLDGHYLVALDGTGYFTSPTIHCASCLQKVHRNGSITYYHQMLGAALDRKSTRLNSSHLVISYAVFCLKKKNNRRYQS